MEKIIKGIKDWWIGKAQRGFNTVAAMEETPTITEQPQMSGAEMAARKGLLPG